MTSIHSDARERRQKLLFCCCWAGLKRLSIEPCISAFDPQASGFGFLSSQRALGSGATEATLTIAAPIAALISIANSDSADTMLQLELQSKTNMHRTPHQLLFYPKVALTTLPPGHYKT